MESKFDEMMNAKNSEMAALRREFEEEAAKNFDDMKAAELEKAKMTATMEAAVQRAARADAVQARTHEANNDLSNPNSDRQSVEMRKMQEAPAQASESLNQEVLEKQVEMGKMQEAPAQ